MVRTVSIMNLYGDNVVAGDTDGVDEDDTMMTNTILRMIFMVMVSW